MTTFAVEALPLWKSFLMAIQASFIFFLGWFLSFESLLVKEVNTPNTFDIAVRGSNTHILTDWR